MTEILLLAAGIILGLLLSRLIFGISSVGTLKSYQGDPDDGPYLFLALSRSVQDVLNKKYVLMKVDVSRE